MSETGANVAVVSHIERRPPERGLLSAAPCIVLLFRGTSTPAIPSRRPPILGHAGGRCASGPFLETQLHVFASRIPPVLPRTRPSSDATRLRGPILDHFIAVGPPRWQQETRHISYEGYWAPQPPNSTREIRGLTHTNTKGEIYN